jgi:25S rRNA (uracil2634-N3)-methyltransferase
MSKVKDATIIWYSHAFLKNDVTPCLQPVPQTMSSKRKPSLGSTLEPIKHKTLSSDDDDIPFRNCDRLCALAATVQCALDNNPCVSCAYKVANFDVALDVSFCQQVPNQRPELCPRASIQQQHNERDGSSVCPVLGYTRGMRVLTVGDGDFSFSVALARLGCRITATSYESKSTILEVYRSVSIEEHLTELHALGCKVIFGVDATNLSASLSQRVVAEAKFHRVVWNFPCSAVAKGQDGQNKEMDRNIVLVQAFVASATPLCKGDGQIHMNHKTKPPFNQWNIAEIAVSAAPDKIRYLGRVVLDRHLFPPYVPRKALDRKSFPCHDACTYIFQLVSSKASEQSQEQDMSSLDARVLSVSTMKDVDPFCLVQVTTDLIRSLRSNLLRHVAKRKPVAKKMKGR